MPEGTPEGMFNFEPESEVSDSERNKAIPPNLPAFYGPDPHPTITGLFVRIPNQSKPNPNISKVLKNFESNSRSCLHAIMTTSYLSANPTEAYKSWINSKISKLKNFGYKVSEKNRYGFVPLMKIWKLRNTLFCLPTPEVKEVVQEADIDSDHPECVMEDVVAQSVASEEQQIEVSNIQQSIGTSSRDISEVLLKTIEDMKVENALVKERLDRQEMIFQLILSRLPSSPPPPQNP